MLILCRFSCEKETCGSQVSAKFKSIPQKFNGKIHERAASSGSKSDSSQILFGNCKPNQCNPNKL